MKEKINEALVLTKKIGEKYELKTLLQKMDNIKSEMSKFSLKILFVGRFSAGKSALINAMLGKEILEENQRPETAIAGEIVYDSEEYVEAVSEDVRDRYKLTDCNAINIDNYNFLIWHLNCPELKELNGNTIVDMPGFNSGIKDHNKAILQYAGKGNAYVLVVDCEEGAIKENMTEFISEIKNYDENMAIVVTKSDLKLPEDVEKIGKSVKSDAELLFGSNVPVITTSKFDDQVQQKMREIVAGFDEDNIYIQKFEPEVYEIAIKCIDSLETFKRSLRLDLSGFDDEIKKHEKSKKELANKLEREKKKLENKFKNTVAPSIMADASEALNSHVDVLADSMNAGGNAFSMNVNNILRPVLLSSTQHYVEQSFEEFLGEISLADTNYDASIGDISENALQKFQKANDKLQEIAKDSGKYNAIYKTITTTLAVATSAIAPWLELVIIFLPDIFKLFSKRNQEDDLKNRVRKIIPEILSKLQPEVEKSLVEMKEEMIQSLTEEIGTLIDSEMESLEKAKREKEKASGEFDKQVLEVETDIDVLRNAIEEISY